ncbi:MAG: protein-S-isoprenylcysteine O-methyltransferase [Anaerolineales bacterium]
MNPLSPETIFRMAFGLLWLVYFGVRLYYQRRIKSGLEYTRVNAQQEKRLFSLFALAFLLLPLYLTSLIDFASLPLPGWLRWGGGVVAALGIFLFGWSHQALGQNWTAVLALAKEHQMVQSGPYKYVRHPMYSAFFIFGIGLALLSANVLIAIIYLGPLSVMYATRVAPEEKMMAERFGEPYREYVGRTGRLWPRLW